MLQEVEKNHQSWVTVLVTKLCLRKKKQKKTLKWKFLTKKWHPRFLEYAEGHDFRLSKITDFDGVLVFFLTKERLILAALKQMILDEIKQSNGIKPQEIYFFMIFCKFFPHNEHFCWKVPSKVIYTFYLKLQKYPFCAPVFHPLSETVSCSTQSKLNF